MRQIFAALLFATACQSAYADRGGYHPEIAVDVAPAKTRAPYDVQIIKQDGQGSVETLPTYALKDRFYVEGAAGERYTIHVTNPTSSRVEAVVSVDGLDAVDGEAGDLRKRGYIVPAYGEVNIEGFRTSLDDVATFRFSSVADSYAGQKGKARNVGVIAVAIFEEAGAPPEQQIVGDNYDYRRDVEDDLANASAKKDAPPPPPSARHHRAAPATTASAPSAPAPAAGKAANAERDGAADDDAREYSEAQRRPGLGTEFGESRYSSATYTRFVRATDRPIAIAELRYNDAAGLTALDIPLQPEPDEYELMTRETANPFPGDRFAQPPR